MSSDQPKQNPPPEPHKGAHSCCCCMKFTWHMLRCPCKIIHAMVNHRCPARRKTKKIKKRPVAPDVGQRAGKNRLARIFELNMNMMENKHEGVLCEVMEDYHWVPFVPQHSDISKPQQNASGQPQLAPGQIEAEPIQAAFPDANIPVGPLPHIQVAPIPAPAEEIVDNPILPQSKKGKIRMVRSNLPSSSEQSEQHQSSNLRKSLKQQQGQLHEQQGQLHEQAYEHDQMDPPEIIASIPNTMDEFYDRLWAKMNAPINLNQGKEQQHVQSEVSKNVEEQQKQLDSLQLQMANQCQLNFICQSDSNKLHQNQKLVQKFLQIQHPIVPVPFLNNENSQKQQCQHSQQHPQAQLLQPLPQKKLYSEQGQMDDNQEQYMVKQNDNSVLDKPNHALANQQQQAKSHKGPSQPEQPLQQPQNQSIQRSQNGSLVVEEDNEDQNLSEPGEIQQDEPDFESYVQTSKQQLINHPKKQQAHQMPISYISSSAKNQHESNFHSLALIKREGANIVPIVVRSREVSYMTQRQPTINHHYSQPQINRQDICQSGLMGQIHSQNQEYQYNHEQLQKEKSKKSRHSIRLNEQLQSQEQRQQTQLQSLNIHNEKYEHNSEGERAHSHNISEYSQFARSLPQFRKLNIKQQQDQSFDPESDIEQAEEKSLNRIMNKKQAKQQSVEEAQNGVKSQRQEDFISENSEVYDEEGSFPDESIESVQPRISSEKDSKEGQPQFEQDQQYTPTIPLRGIQPIQPILTRDAFGLKEQQQEQQQQDEEEQLQREIQLNGVAGKKKVKAEEEISQSFLASSKAIVAPPLFNMSEQNQHSSSNNFNDGPISRSFFLNQDIFSESYLNQIKIGNGSNQLRLKLDPSQHSPNLQISNPLPNHDIFLKRQPKFQSFQFAKLQNSDSKREKLELINTLDVVIQRGNMNAAELALLPTKTKVERINIISQFSFSNTEFIDLQRPKEENRPEHSVKEQGDDYQEVEEEIIYTRKKRPKSHRKNFIEEMYPSRRHKSGRHHKSQKQSKHRRHYQDYYGYDDGPYEYREQSNSDEEKYVRQRKKSKRMSSEKKHKKHLRKIEEQDESNQISEKLYKHE